MARYAVLCSMLLGACARGGTPPAGGTAASFSISVEPTEVPIVRGSSGWVAVALHRDAGFGADVEVGVPDPPPGVFADAFTYRGDISRQSLRLATAATVTAGDLPVTLVARSGDQEATAKVVLHVAEPGPESLDLITAAQTAGTIDLGTALLYRAYARTGDELLPDAFRGAGIEDLTLNDDVDAATPMLDSPALAALHPYMVRPGHPDSVYSRAHTGGTSGLHAGLSAPGETCEEGQAWRSKRSAIAPVRVWIECFEDEDAIEVGSMNKTLDTAERVWGPMTALMGAPILDAGGDDEGGDDAIDVYLVVNGIQRAGMTHDQAALIDLDARAYSMASPPYSRQGGIVTSSGFIVAPRDGAQTESARATLVHELFHVMQDAHNRIFRKVGSSPSQPHWFIEASAAWAKVHYDRTLSWPRRVARFEHNQRFSDFQASDRGLNATTPLSHTYAAYAWPLFLELDSGSEDVIGAIWSDLGGASSFQAADQAIDAHGAFADKFRTFALRNLNQSFLPGDPLPESQRYLHLDPEFPDGLYAPSSKVATVTKDVPSTVPLTLQPLSAAYIHVGGVDGTLGQVEFDLTGLQPSGNVQADVILSTSSGYVAKAVKLDDSGKTVFCFDQGPATETVRGSFVTADLIISNHDMNPAGIIAGDVRITGKGAPCGVWSGTASWVLASDDGHSKLDVSFDATVTLEYDDQAPPGVGIPLRIRAGSYVYQDHVDNYDGHCQTHGTSAGQMHRGDESDMTEGSTRTDVRIIPGFDPPQYTASATTYTVTTYYSTCNDGHMEMAAPPATEAMFWLDAEDPSPVLEDDGTTMKGMTQSPIGSGTMTRTWSFTKMDE